MTDPGRPMLSLPSFMDVGPDRVRHLCDGREAYPAMLAAIAAASREVLLEMYWVGADSAGVRFRDALVACARRGVSVRVLYDDVGSVGLWSSWWDPLRQAGGKVAAYNPIGPWRRRFRWGRVFFRDHRKLLIVDGRVGFVGGINLARPWLPRNEGGLEWRDDAVEVCGPAAAELRVLFGATWESHAGAALAPDPEPPPANSARRTLVLANRIGRRPNRRIRRAYLLAIHRARLSIDIASSYFLPGPLFLRALRLACRRGVRVRILVPKTNDIWLVSLATSQLVGRLLESGVEVCAYTRGMMHSKTAIIDGRVATIGSHNLDTLSWRYNLECNIAIVDAAFAHGLTETFERDLDDAERVDLSVWRARPVARRILGWCAARIRMFL